MISHQELKKILPHAYPFLLIDRVTGYKKNEYLTAVKNITANEWPFSQNNSRCAIFPETLLIEAAAQAALVLYHLSKVEGDDKPNYYIGIIKLEMPNVLICPGDKLSISALATKLLRHGGYSEIGITIRNKKIRVYITYSVKWS